MGLATFFGFSAGGAFTAFLTLVTLALVFFAGAFLPGLLFFLAEVLMSNYLLSEVDFHNTFLKRFVALPWNRASSLEEVISPTPNSRAWSRGSSAWQIPMRSQKLPAVVVGLGRLVQPDQATETGVSSAQKRHRRWNSDPRDLLTSLVALARRSFPEKTLNIGPRTERNGHRTAGRRRGGS